MRFEADPPDIQTYKPMGSTLAKTTELELQAQKSHTLTFLSKKNNLIGLPTNITNAKKV